MQAHLSSDPIETDSSLPNRTNSNSRGVGMDMYKATYNFIVTRYTPDQTTKDTTIADSSLICLQILS